MNVHKYDVCIHQCVINASDLGLRQMWFSVFRVAPSRWYFPVIKAFGVFKFY